MYCDVCHQNIATIHIQEILNGSQKTLHLCIECALKKKTDNPLLNGLDLSELLYSTISQLKKDKPNNEISTIIKEDFSGLGSCPQCGYNVKQFLQSGKLRCSTCWNTFFPAIEPLLKSLHRGTEHVGIHPTSQNADKNKNYQNQIKISQLTKELAQVIKKEEYEKAALIRDQINQLKKRLKNYNDVSSPH